MEITEFHKCRDPLEWQGLYSGEKKFRKYLSAETNAHPAKMSMLLADKIVRHLEVLGLLKQSDTIIDFMAGTARTGVVAELHNHAFIGVELEDHFIAMQGKNKEQIERSLHRKASWQLLQGDARNLSKLLKEKGVGIVSPPYENAITPGMKEGEIDKAVERRVKQEERQVREGRKWGVTSKEAIERSIKAEHLGYSTNPKNIGNLKDTNKASAGLVSPPYENAIYESQGGIVGREKGQHSPGSQLGQAEGYSLNKENIGNLKDRLVGVTSPPYSQAQDGGGIFKKGYTGKKAPDHEIGNRTYSKSTHNQSQSAEQLGALKEESYLSAMQQVYSEAFKSGISPLVTVTKNPTRKGELRRLDVDTAKLLIRAGYKIVDYHRALLFYEGSQFSLSGNKTKKYNGRLSFFKRISAEKGNVVAKWEDVIVAVIQEGGGHMVGISSPPYGEGLGHISKDAKDFGNLRLGSAAYGNAKGQIGRFKDKPLKSKTSAKNILP